MKNLRLPILFIISAIIFYSCTPEDEPVKIYNAGIISDVFGWEDNGLSKYARSGMEYMGNLENIKPFYYESHDTLAIEENINSALSDSCDLIIALSSRAEEQIVAAAIANPYTDFLMVDHKADTTLPNLQCIVFNVEQSAFPCGYLAAAYSDQDNGENPAAGWIRATQYKDSHIIQHAYTAGIAYYNDLYNRNVESYGVTFENMDDWQAAADAVDSLFINNSISIIFPFTGMGNIGAYEKISEYEIAALGMEMDSYFDFTAVKKIFLSSCVKRYDLAVADMVLEFSSGYFQGSHTSHYNLSNKGVWIAGYHDFLDFVPDSITDGINDILNGIISGEIDPLPER